MSRRRDLDEPNMSDTGLLITVEDLINQAMGPPSVNMINFKIMQAVLHILARQQRLLEQRVEIKIAEVSPPRHKLKKQSQVIDDSSETSSSSSPRGRMAGIKEEREARTRERGQRERERAEKLAQRAREKEDRAASKEREKAVKAASKEREKAEKAAAKERERAEKASSKEREKAVKAQLKAEREVSKERDKQERTASKEREKAEKAKAKAERAASKEREKEERTASKERERAEKAQSKAERAASKEREKEERTASKERERAERAQSKAERAASKEREKEERAASKEREKEERAASKERERADKGQSKAERASSKEREKEEKAALKQKEREDKEQTKAERQAQKEQEKAEKERQKADKLLQKEQDKADRAAQKEKERMEKEKIKSARKERKPSDSGISVKEVKRGKDSVLIVEKGPTTWSDGQGRGSIEVVTQSQFTLLEAAVRELRDMATPQPLAMPDNEKLRSDLAKGQATLPATMQAMQIDARVKAAENAIARMTGLLTQLAAAGELPEDLGQQMEEIQMERAAADIRAEDLKPHASLARKSVIIAPTAKISEASARASMAPRPSTAPASRPSVSIMKQPSSRVSTTTLDLGVSRDEMEDAVNRVREELIKSMNMMTSRAGATADNALHTAKSACKNLLISKLLVYEWSYRR